jgi:carboxymethylenebutenolidase
MTRIRRFASTTLAVLALSIFVPAASVDAQEGERETLAEMADQHRGETPEETPIAAGSPEEGVVTEEVGYADLDGTKVTGYLARPAGGGEGAPGILVIQEWWGLNDNIRAMARRLAAEGYVALAVDLYEGEVATDSDTARSLMMASLEKTDRLAENLRQGNDYLKRIGAGRIGTIGWCFGGGWSLQAGLRMPDAIDATVIYYGRLVTDEAELEPIRAPILGIFGDLDRGIPVESVRAFEAALENLGKEAEIHVYEGADHAFANPSGTRYDERAATDAWGKTLAFFAAHLRD